MKVTTAAVKIPRLCLKMKQRKRELQKRPKNVNQPLVSYLRRTVMMLCMNQQEWSLTPSSPALPTHTHTQTPCENTCSSLLSPLNYSLPAARMERGRMLWSCVLMHHLLPCFLASDWPKWKRKNEMFFMFKDLPLSELLKQETKVPERSWKNQQTGNTIRDPFCSVGHHR